MMNGKLRRDKNGKASKPGTSPSTASSPSGALSLLPPSLGGYRPMFQQYKPPTHEITPARELAARELLQIWFVSPTGSEKKILKMVRGSTIEQFLTVECEKREININAVGIQSLSGNPLPQKLRLTEVPNNSIIVIDGVLDAQASRSPERGRTRMTPVTGNPFVNYGITCEEQEQSKFSTRSGIVS